LEEKLFRTLDLCRFVYNWALESLKEKPNLYEVKRRLPKLKEERPELKDVYSQVLQNEVVKLFNNLRILSGLKRSGCKVGKLRFKGEGWFKSFTYPQFGFKIENKKLVLSKVGEIPIKLHRVMKGKIKRLTIKRERSGKWYAIFQVEDGLKPLPKTGRMVGMDMGIKNFLTDTEGRQVENPRFYERALERIRKLYRQLSRKQKGSKNRKKARIMLARAYERFVNQRDDFLHKLSRFYVNNYDAIAVEDLNIAGMAKNHHLARKILDASWGKFLHNLSYKAERAGRTVVKVNPRGTSQEYKNGELDKDFNAALNILERGLVGLGRPEPTPVEMEPPRELITVPASTVVESGSPYFFREGSSPRYF
jgi:putative transposase